VDEHVKIPSVIERWLAKINQFKNRPRILPAQGYLAVKLKVRITTAQSPISGLPATERPQAKDTVNSIEGVAMRPQK
jgi:hypothetical protein